MKYLERFEVCYTAYPGSWWHVHLILVQIHLILVTGTPDHGADTPDPGDRYTWSWCKYIWSWCTYTWSWWQVHLIMVQIHLIQVTGTFDHMEILTLFAIFKDRYLKFSDNIHFWIWNKSCFGHHNWFLINNRFFVEFSKFFSYHQKTKKIILFSNITFCENLLLLIFCASFFN